MQPTSTSKRPQRRKNLPARAANLGSPRGSAPATPSQVSATQIGDAPPISRENAIPPSSPELADPMRRLQDRITQLERELRRGQATNFPGRRQRPSHRYGKGAPTIVDGVLRSRQATVPSVERPEMTGVRAHGSRPPRFTDPLVRDRARSGSPPDSGDDFSGTGFSQASDYTTARSRTYICSLKVKDLLILIDRVDPIFPT